MTLAISGMGIVGEPTPHSEAVFALVKLPGRTIP